MAAHLPYIVFVFALGACVGSFLNVVVWRLPRGESLISPPSRCPQCGTKLAWYDNFPVFGWLWLRGRCRYCASSISARYPTVEFFTATIFVFYYVMFFLFHIGPCAPLPAALPPDLLGRIKEVDRPMTAIAADWPIYGLLMFMLASLLAASLIDAELFIIPLEIPWLMALFGVIVHSIVDRPTQPGAINVDTSGFGGAVAAGGAVGLAASIILFFMGKMPQSFPQGEPALEVDEVPAEPQPIPSPGWLSRGVSFFIEAYRGKPSTRQRELMKLHNARPSALAPADKESNELPPPPGKFTKAEIRAEIRKEILFLLPPAAGALLTVLAVILIRPIGDWWRSALQMNWLSGLLGSLLGAMVGGLVVWLARIGGTLGFGRVAMGLGDVHLMFGVGAIIGAGPATIAFFIAPFAALLIGLYMLLTRSRHELPYGPYLSLATAAVLLCYCPIADYLRPGIAGVAAALRIKFGA